MPEIELDAVSGGDTGRPEPLVSSPAATQPAESTTPPPSPQPSRRTSTSSPDPTTDRAAPDFTLDAYAVRSCPLKTLYRHHPGYRNPPTTVEPAVFADDAAAFDELVLQELLQVPGAVDASELEPDAALAVLEKGAPVVVRPALPRSLATHRSGRIDAAIQVGTRSDGRPGYLPLEIKFHRNLDDAGSSRSLTASTLAAPAQLFTDFGHKFKWKFRLPDLLHLSHDWFRLVDAELAADGPPRGGLVGNDRPIDPRIVWLELDAPVVPPNPRVLVDAETSIEPITILDRYHYEHEYRQVAARAGLAAAAGDPPAIRPIAYRECTYCPWWPACRPQLADDDISLVVTRAAFDLQEIRTLRSLGIETSADLLAADLDELMPAYLPHVTHRDGSEDRLRLAQHRCQMAADGVLLERTSGRIELPKHQIEIDFDIETSASERVYLWGFYVDDGVNRPYFKEFSSFVELDETAEADLAVSALTWLRELVGGSDFAIYHYSPYEVNQLRRMAAIRRDPALTWVLTQLPHFVDLFPVVKSNFFSLEGLGLKVLATRGAGYQWRDPDPGGLNSISWYNEAVSATDPQVREAARLRVLEYNEDDVRATRALRRWLRSLPK